MTMRRIVRLASLGLALAFALAPAAAYADTCTADSFGDAVDASAAELRAFSAETQPKLKQKLQALKDHKQWPDADYESKGLKLVHDARLDEFDAEASELLSKIDTLGSPESGDETASTSCAHLSDLKAASSELMAVMRAKSAYLIAKIDREIAKTDAGAPQTVAKVETTETPPPAPATAPAAEAPQPPAAEPAPSLSPMRKTETAKKDAAPAPAQPDPAPPAAAPAKPGDGETERSSSWDTTTAQAVIPPPALPRGPSGEAGPPPEPDYYAAPPGAPYELPPPALEGEDGASTFDAEGGGYSIDEIREATRGFFGTVSTSLASVIEHAFQKGGRPTAYVLGNEGGGAFLAGLRYGEGTLYLRSGGSQKVYWHGPSIGYDVGAEGSQTLILIYDLHEADTLFRRFTGVDGSAYLVGGVGMTLLKGGPVMMAPIRSGLGLRLGASIGYVRFSSRPTWNPF